MFYINVLIVPAEWMSVDYEGIISLPQETGMFLGCPLLTKFQGMIFFLRLSLPSLKTNFYKISVLCGIIFFM